MTKPTRIRANARVHLYLKEWMAVKGFTQPRLANSMGVARNTVTRWANDKRGVDKPTLARLAEVLGIDDPLMLYRYPDPLPTRESVDKVLAEADEEAYSAVLNLAKQLSRRAG